MKTQEIGSRTRCASEIAEFVTAVELEASFVVTGGNHSRVFGQRLNGLTQTSGKSESQDPSQC